MRAGALTGIVAGIGGVGSAAWAVRGRSSQVFGTSVWRGRPGRRAVALTFDDGPSSATPEILRVLEEYGVRGTFFQCGVNVRRAPELCLAVHRAGHEIGNHSHTHPNCALRRRSFIEKEFAAAQYAIAEHTGVKPSLLRAPYGVRWFGFREMQQKLGLQGVMWSVIGRDWKLPAHAVAKRVVEQVTDGAIVCLHDGRGTLKDPDAGNTVEAVRRIVPALLENGYHFEAVSRML